MTLAFQNQWWYLYQIWMIWISDHKDQQKKFDWSGMALLLFRSHENGHFWPFFTIQNQGIEQTKSLLLCWNYPLDIISQKKLLRNSNHMQSFSYSVHLLQTSFSMTTLLTHTVAHSTTPSFMPKTNNQPPKKF